MNIAVSGSNGFIGSHLVKRLRNEGHGVLPIPRNHLKYPNDLGDLFKTFPPDYIIHLAAYGNHSSQKEPSEMLNVNVIGTYNLLTSLNNVPFKGFINIGSSSEYGIKDGPMSENDVPETDTFYGATKVAGTYLARAFAREYKRNIVTVRPFSVYGPGEADFRFIPTVCHALNENKVISVATEPMHDWIYIDDFVDGVMRVVENIERLSGQIINIGTGEQYSNLEIVMLLEKVSGKTLIFDIFGMSDMRTYDSHSWVAENRKLKKLGWLPKHSIVDGLKKTYTHYAQPRPQTENT